jgi:cellobiose phosphorylase
VRRQGTGNDVSLSVDGKPVAGCVVPLPPAGVAEVKVEVKLGKA